MSPKSAFSLKNKEFHQQQVCGVQGWDSAWLIWNKQLFYIFKNFKQHKHSP